MDICKSDQTTQGKFRIQVQPNLEQLKLECHPKQPVNVVLSCEPPSITKVGYEDRSLRTIWEF